jgi:fermentation-respiration switch protein FrsA (DUF1100 family)
MSILKAGLVVVLAVYLGVALVLYVTQRSLMYFPEKLRTAPGDAGFPEATEVVLGTSDGERIIAWHVPPRAGAPVILYFHGNGGSLRGRADRYRALTSDGTGLVALSYRGYAGSSGEPTEAGLLLDASAAYDFARSRHLDAKLVVWGESLGSGVAVALAADKAVERVVLEAPFLSAADIGAAAYPYVPVRWLMKDQFRSDLRIGRVKAPVLILHGDHDTVVPIESGERLYALITAPKRFVRFPGGGHEDLGTHGAVEAAKSFLADKLD